MSARISFGMSSNDCVREEEEEEEEEGMVMDLFGSCKSNAFNNTT